MNLYKLLYMNVQVFDYVLMREVNCDMCMLKYAVFTILFIFLLIRIFHNDLYIKLNLVFSNEFREWIYSNVIEIWNQNLWKKILHVFTVISQFNLDKNWCFGRGFKISNFNDSRLIPVNHRYLVLNIFLFISR